MDETAEYYKRKQEEADYPNETTGNKSALSDGLDTLDIAGLKRWQEACAKMSKMKYAILEAVEYLDGNKLNQIGSESIIHKNLRDVIKGV